MTFATSHSTVRLFFRFINLSYCGNSVVQLVPQLGHVILTISPPGQPSNCLPTSYASSCSQPFPGSCSWHPLRP